jgi:hypothetical protein
VISARWGDYDVHGLQGSITDGGGYAFLMNSFALAWPMVPTVKYDNRYANAVGKWMLNVANAARLCYPYEIDDQHQFLPGKKDITRNVIAYEGIRKQDDYGKESLKGMSPVATGDGPKWVKGQPEESMFSLYSSCQVGIFGSIVKKTNVEKILQLDCNATDFYSDETWPTYLYYNPYDEEKTVAFESYDGNTFDLYDALTCDKIMTDVSGSVDFPISPKSSRLIVVIPAKSKIEKNGSVYTAAGKVVAYAAPEK